MGGLQERTYAPLVEWLAREAYIFEKVVQFHQGVPMDILQVSPETIQVLEAALVGLCILLSAAFGALAAELAVNPY